RFFERNGQDVRAHHHDDLGTDGEHDGILQGLAEAGALQDAAKIFQPDEMQAGIADAGITERIKDGQAKRSADQQHDIQDCRAEHGKSQEWALRGANGFDFASSYCGLGYCHVKALASTFFSVARSKNFRWRSSTAKS